MSNVPPNQNSYLQQVLAEKVELEEDLRTRRRKVSAPELDEAPAARSAGGMAVLGRARAAHAPSEEASPSDVRITGALFWKNVVVPPNAYVVHTRRGREAPMHIGLGVSFRFNPRTDAFLVVPSAMQTILIHANCICRERQGLVVQGYVQWVIDDFATAYHKLDFSDESEPMRMVNVQLREQAEAAIKDKVATMSIDDVLTDKQPIIEELTARLRSVAEGVGDADKGLGLRIVTVQIKEAVVCSPTVWESLQRPFRAERKRQARLPELENEALIQQREAQAAKERTEMEIEAKAEIARLESEAKATAFARAQQERLERARQEAEALAQAEAHERLKLDHEHTLTRLRLQQQLELERMRLEMVKLEADQRIALEGAQRQVDNDHSQAALRMALIERLPDLAQALPHPERLTSVQLGDDSLTKGLRQLTALLNPAGAPEGAG